MSKTKSVIVTVIVCVLLGIAAFAAYRLWAPAFVIMTATFSGIGFLSAASYFCTWLEAETGVEETPVEPIKLEREPDLGSDFATTFDEIKKELEVEA